jgi:hypothetical protein
MSLEPRTALGAFMQEDHEPPPPVGDGGGTTGGRRTTTRKPSSIPTNVYLESLFVCHPIIAAPTLGVGAAATLPKGATTAASAAPLAATPNYYLTLNPMLTGEHELVPVMQGEVYHTGAKCLPHERIIQVARYGRIYKRKAPTSHWKQIRTDAPPGMRFCRFCDGFQPLKAFYTRKTRNVCRKHHAERVFHADKARMERDPTDVGALDAWLTLRESQHLFGYVHLNYDRTDIRNLVVHTGIPWGIQPRAMPIDPSLPLRPRNVAIVSHSSFELLVRIFEHACSRALYIAQVQRCNLLPPHCDAGWPERPFHDPAYRRVDIDVGPLLHEELQGPLECADRTLMESLVQNEPAAPWHTYPGSTQPVSIAMRVRWGLHQQRQTNQAPPIQLMGRKAKLWRQIQAERAAQKAAAAEADMDDAHSAAAAST